LKKVSKNIPIGAEIIKEMGLDRHMFMAWVK
jgi:hypothetical protein